MRADRITVEPFREITITDYQGLKQMNQHGEVNLTGSIPIDKMSEYFDLARTVRSVKITAVELTGQSQIMMCGNLTACDIRVEGDAAMMTLQIKTATNQMERVKHLRTFQDLEMTYRRILDICNQSYDHSDVIMTVGKETKVSDFIVQYQENDWEFLKRVAARLNTVIVPDTQTGEVKYFFGLPRFSKKIFSQTSAYKICSNLEEFETKKGQGLCSYEETCRSYIVSSREVFEIGNRMEFLEKELYIYRIESELQGRELYHTYFLKSEQGLKEAGWENANIVGASLTGTVKDVRNDQVQVRIDQDENKKKSGNRWFAFATVYSSPDGTGWYCMPEIGDTVRLCFPSETARDAYVSSAVHQGSIDRKNAGIKFLKNRYGKEIRLTPEQIILTNNDGTSIEISDRKGIRLKSSESITLNARDNICISSRRADVKIKAETNIRLEQREAAINLNEDISLEGAQVKLH